MDAIDFSLGVDPNIILERIYRKHFFYNKLPFEATNGSSSSTIRIDTGAEYVDPWQSYVRFRLSPLVFDAASEIPLPTLPIEPSLAGGPVSLIRSVSMTTADGQEVYQCEEINELNKFLLPTLLGDDYMETIGASARGLVLDKKKNDGSYLVSVPLPFLAPVFRSNKLLPPHFMNGLRIRINWAKSEDVFRGVIPEGVVVTDVEGLRGKFPYTISELELHMDHLVLDGRVTEIIDKKYVEIGIPIKMNGLTLANRSTIRGSQPRDPVSIPQSFTRATKIYGVLLPRPFKDLSAPEYDGANLLPSFEYQADYNGTLTPHYVVDDAERRYLYYAAAHGYTKHVHTANSKELKDYVRESNIFAIGLQRRVEPFNCPQLHTDMLAAFSGGGRRIDGTNPMQVFVSFSDSDLLELPKARPDIQSFSGETDLLLWVEFESFIILQASGNNVFT